MIKKCQVFTPAQNVVELLDAVNYTNNLFGKKVIENACGDGNILIEIVKRYIEDALQMNKNIDEIKIGLEQDVYGAEIDKVHYKKCVDNLDIVAKKYGIINVKWKVLNTDILKEELPLKFDFIISNPPYISYRDLDDGTRNYIKENFNSCACGKFDYCYAFIEGSINSLSNTGRLGYLIPSSIFKNVYAQELRNMIMPYVTKIVDYTTQKLFAQAITSSAILVCDKNINHEYVEYKDVVAGKVWKINKNCLSGKWMFLNSDVNKLIKRKFGDYFSASISIATLFNKAFVLKEYVIEKDYIRVENFNIERDVIREGVSPKSLNYNKKEFLLFPYQYKDGQLIRYKREEFEEHFVGATKYLKSFHKELSERKSDKNVEWFEYGRTQALVHLDQPKLLLSTVITKEVKVYELTKECIPYSGIYIVPKADLPLSEAKKILESESFYKYVQAIGINASGSSMRITAVDINNFEF